MAKAKLGSGKRFAKLAASIESKEGYGEDRANAIAASIGRKKYGAVKMSSLATKGRKRKAKMGD